MTIEYLKKAENTPKTGEEDSRRIVTEMLAEIETVGEDKVREYSKEIDQYTGKIVVPAEVSAF
jgi:sulfopropanediol 3-dehydrogenase